MVELQTPQLDTVFHALGDATRRRMLRDLAGGERTVGQLAEPFAMSLAAASKHIKVLENAGLLRREVRGRTHLCRLAPGPLASAHQWLRFYERFWTYLTKSNLRRTWLAAGEMALQVGAPFELVWRNDDLTDPPGQRPPGVGAEHRMQRRLAHAPRRAGRPRDRHGTGTLLGRLEPPAAGIRPAAASLTARTACRRRAPPAPRVRGPVLCHGNHC